MVRRVAERGTRETVEQRLQIGRCALLKVVRASVELQPVEHVAAEHALLQVRIQAATHVHAEREIRSQRINQMREKGTKEKGMT